MLDYHVRFKNNNFGNIRYVFDRDTSCHFLICNKGLFYQNNKTFDRNKNSVERLLFIHFIVNHNRYIQWMF